MDRPTEEQIKEFWEWCGFKKAGGGWTNRVYKYPFFKGVAYGIFDGKYAFFPPLDLNSLFKYAVPRFPICDLSIEEALFAVVKVSHPEYGSSSHLEEIIDNRPDKAFALALFWAIYKVIKKGVVT